MVDCVTSLYVKNVATEEFKKWLDKETDEWTDYNLAEGWDLYAEIEGGYGGYFWEALALKMANAFKGIAFEGLNQIITDDYIIGTTFACNGMEIKLERYIELPSDCDDEIDEEYKEELEGIRNVYETEYDVPYLAKFDVKDVISCSEVYDMVGKKLKDTTLVETTCAEHNIPQDKFMEFANIINFKKRK